MNEVEKLFHEDLKRNTFAEAVMDDNFDFIDNMTNEVDYTGEGDEF